MKVHRVEKVSEQKIKYTKLLCTVLIVVSSDVCGISHGSRVYMD